MKRFVLLGLVLAILAVGFTAFADPIVVGGRGITSFINPEAVLGNGNGNGIPTHLGGNHTPGTPAPFEGVNRLSSPIVVGGR